MSERFSFEDKRSSSLSLRSVALRTKSSLRRFKRNNFLLTLGFLATPTLVRLEVLISESASSNEKELMGSARLEKEAHAEDSVSLACFARLSQSVFFLPIVTVVDVLHNC
jgi:hypothetical protein